MSDERAENEGNRKEITSLSKRVENEANELLNIVNANSEEVASLKTVISTHQATIKTLQDQAAQRTTEHEELIIERTSEIEELRIMGGARLETIVVLEAHVEDLKKKFAAQEENTRVTIDAMNLAHRRLMEENEQLGDAMKKRFADTNKAVQELKTKRVEIKTHGVDLDRVQTGKVVKTTEKVKVAKKGSKKKVATRSWRDSGYGLDGEEDGNARIDNGDMEEDFLAA